MKHIKGSLVAWALVLSGVAFIASPVRHTVATSGSAVSTAGAGAFGQLGDETNTALSTSHTVIAPATLANKTIQKISVGYEHTCVTTNDATANIYCWGRNADGKLGDGSTTTRTAPARVAAGSGILQASAAIAVTAGTDHTCALVPQTVGPRSGYNEVLCWGRSASLGRGNSPTGTTEPNVLNPMPASGATDIDTYDNSTCIALTTGLINCWGLNSSGQLGNASTTVSTVLVSVVSSGALSGKTPIDIEVGSFMTCVLTNEATNNLYCWGLSGTTGSLGNGVTGGSTTPVAISLGGAKLTKLDIGNGHACGVTSDNRLLCWGDNLDNHLGISGAPAVVTTPTAIDVSGAMGALSLAGVATGNSSTCVWSTTGRLVCFGYTKGHFGVNPSTVAGAVDLGGYHVLRTPTAITGGSLAANGVRDFAMGDFTTSGAIVSALTSDESTANASASTTSSNTTSSSTTSTTLASGSTTSSTVGAGTSTTAPTTTSSPSSASLKVTFAKLTVAKGVRRLSVTTSQKVKVLQISYGRKRPSVAPKKFGAAVLRRTVTIAPTGTVWVRAQSGSTWSPWVRAK
jgi:alpha-tubulin suppressor-like RCC1 family protein